MCLVISSVREGEERRERISSVEGLWAGLACQQACINAINDGGLFGGMVGLLLMN